MCFSVYCFIKKFFFKATKNPIILNLKGGIIGLHKMGTSKKSSGTNSDCGPQRKFWPATKKSKYFYRRSISPANRSAEYPRP